jgi:hypothetical protein
MSAVSRRKKVPVVKRFLAKHVSVYFFKLFYIF